MEAKLDVTWKVIISYNDLTPMQASIDSHMRGDRQPIGEAGTTAVYPAVKLPQMQVCLSRMLEAVKVHISSLLGVARRL